MCAITRDIIHQPMDTLISRVRIFYYDDKTFGFFGDINKFQGRTHVLSLAGILNWDWDFVCERRAGDFHG
jgi:hypothetical protein